MALNSIEVFELIGEMFRKDTGLLRPGKSYPLEMFRPDDLDERFRAWVKANQTHVDAVIEFGEDWQNR